MQHSYTIRIALKFWLALSRQVNDLQELLGPEWDHRGVGRDDGKEAGEFRFGLLILPYFI